MAAGLRRALDGAAFAITFLTILPVPVRDEPDDGGTAPAWYPLVGAVVGAVAGGVFAAADAGVGASVAAVAAIGTLVVLTGGLHQDGLADCADGMGVRGNLERRLTVMRDPAIGSFGMLALLLWALLLTVSLAQLSRGEALAALITAAAVGRWSALLHARWAPPARRDGLGSAFSPSTPAVAVAGLTAVTVAAIADVASAVAVVGAGVLVAAAVSVWSRRALGGRTGDTLGASVALTELVVILVLLTFARHT
jgi:adenosylcobinamide-GDP ribazoletransferase